MTTDIPRAEQRGVEENKKLSGRLPQPLDVGKNEMDIYNIMKKALIMLILGVSAVLAEKVPVEVQQLIDSAMSGKHPVMVHFNMNVPHAAYKLSDLKAGEPIHFYWFFPDSVKKLGTNAPVSSIIKPLDEWGVPLLLNGKPKILLEISKSRTNPIWHIMGYGQGQIANGCNRVSQLWPESAGYHPFLSE